MRIVLGRTPVGRPAGVRHADGAGQRRLAQLVFQRTHLAHGTRTTQFSGRVDDRHASGVIPAVFEAMQPLDQNLADITLSQTGNDATHEKFLYCVPPSWRAWHD